MKNTRRIACLLIVPVMILTTACATTDTAEVKKKAEATRRVGEAYMLEHNYTAALKELLQAEKLYPDDHILQFDLGLAYRKKGRLDLSIEHFEKAIALKPDFAPAINNLGMAYIAGKQWDKAIETFEPLTGNLLYATPQYPRFGLGLAYYNKGNYREAEKYLNEALQFYRDGYRKDTTFIYTLQGLGVTYLALSQLDRAEQMLEEAVRYAPKLAGLYFDLGRVYVTMKKYDQAEYVFSKVIELRPDSDIARQAKIERRKVRALKAG